MYLSVIFLFTEIKWKQAERLPQLGSSNKPNLHQKNKDNREEYKMGQFLSLTFSLYPFLNGAAVRTTVLVDGCCLVRGKIIGKGRGFCWRLGLFGCPCWQHNLTFVFGIKILI